MTYAGVEAHLAKRFPSATFWDEEAQENPRLPLSGSSCADYLLPRPMTDLFHIDESRRARKDSSCKSNADA